MAVKLLCLCLLLALLYSGWAKEQSCLKSASSCNECIQSGPECAWCTAPDSKIRCNTLKRLQRSGCPKEYVYNPQGEVQVVKNDSSTEPADANTVFLQPQEFSLRLRPGVSQSFLVTIIMPRDQPITELTMNTDPVPVDVNITFSSIMTGNPLVIQVNVEAARCLTQSDDSNQMQNGTGPQSVYITPRGFSPSVKLEITLECQCDCTRKRVENSLSCSGRGALACGQCECYKSYIGQQCQWGTDLFSSSNDNRCRSGPNAPVCSGRGECVEGFCECRNRENPKEMISGRFCQCSNFDCPYHNGRICGGHGRCECGNCICDDDWTSEDCSCSMETTSCMAANQRLCNDRGMCQCGECKCERPYAGPTCEVCPVCQGTCQQHAQCVECRVFGKGAKKDRCDQDCNYLIVTVVETKDDLTQPEFCKMISHDNHCFFYYTVSSGGQLTVARAKECPRN